jgi:hypothetical protein
MLGMAVVDTCGLHARRVFSSARMIVSALALHAETSRYWCNNGRPTNRNDEGSLTIPTLRGKTSGRYGLELRGRASCGATQPLGHEEMRRGSPERTSFCALVTDRPTLACASKISCSSQRPRHDEPRCFYRAVERRPAPFPCQ